MNIAVYCGAHLGNEPIYEQAAKVLGTWIAKNGHQLIYGGGKVGLMGVVADTVLANNGQVIGVIPTFLKERELAHENLTQLHVVDSMSARKNNMLALADVCIALPGGIGTLEEIVEAFSWARVGQNNSPCIFYDTHGFYQQIRAFFDQLVESAFLSASDREKVLFSSSFDEIEAFIQTYVPPQTQTYSK